MHSYVRRSILPSYGDVHGGRFPWQLHRRHGHGASRSENCPPIQWAVYSGRFGPNGHCTFHYPTGPRKVISSIAATTPHLVACRFLTGCGAGIGLCTGPVFLAEIAPSNIRGSVGTCTVLLTYSSSSPKTGVLTQLAIVLGIMITQMLGMRMATPTLWRFVLSFSSAASVVQLCLSRFIVETPVWLKQHGKPEDSRLVQSSLFQEPGDSGFMPHVLFLLDPCPFPRVLG
jgi:MFS family permease